jgi:hypothetical protein
VEEEVGKSASMALLEEDPVPVGTADVELSETGHSVVPVVAMTVVYVVDKVGQLVTDAGQLMKVSLSVA